MSRALPYLWYPAFFAAAIAAFAALLAAEWHLLAALYVPIAAVALAVIVLERWSPERVDWRPGLRDVVDDGLFIAVVQVGVARLLAAALALAAAQWTHAHGPSPLWPHHWPLAVQTLVMVLCVDLLRYWLHRACHTFAPLWRLHEVHHSPDILYTLNVGRFHPLEKALHFCADTAPFVLLGVAPEVLAGYFLLYAVNGFFQHSNLKLRYGLLNYVVGSAETHRWHHARDPRTARCNFSNTTIVWDLVFGTWYLPKQRKLEIGIPDRAYPKDFWSQMWTPFRPRERNVGSGSRFVNAVIAAKLRWTDLLCGLRLARAARNPLQAQRRVLVDILRRNRDTSFGRRHGFAGLRDERDYMAAVPVGDFEAHRPDVEAEVRGQASALTAEAPVCYLRTSGTTGQPKDVPLTPRHLRRLRRLQQWAVARQHRLCPAAFAGSIFVVTSPAREGTAANGKPWGSASGVVAGATPRMIREKFVVPAPVLGIDDSRLKYLTMLRLALARDDITYLGAANPSTLLGLARMCREHLADLAADVARGGFSFAARLEDPVRTAIEPRLAAAPARGRQLQALLASGRPLRLGDLWPDLRLVVTWTGGSAGVALRALRAELPAQARIHELGYLASEFHGTVTLGRLAGSGLPTFDTHFFEFVERDRWDRGEPVFLTLDRLRRGQIYYVLATTPSGLYRYFINDLVRVRGHLHRMPLIQFVQKGKGVTSITGEKLYEAQVLEAVQQSLAALGRAARFVMMLADEQASGYRLYVEVDGGPTPDARRLAQDVDARLQASNVEYQAKRASERLQPLIAQWLRPGSEERYRRFSVERGQREGQFKTVALAYRSQFDFDLEALVASE